jgi:IS4 transposase
MVMETFTVVIKGLSMPEKTHQVKIKAEDGWLAHKYGLEHYNELKEEIVQIRDSRNNEVYNRDKGFLFE